MNKEPYKLKRRKLKTGTSYSIISYTNSKATQHEALGQIDKLDALIRLKEWNTGKVNPKNSKKTLEEAIDLFTDYYKDVVNAKNTMKNHLCNINKIKAAIGRVNLKDFKDRHVLDLKDSLNKSVLLNTSKNKILFELSKILKWFKREEMIDAMPDIPKYPNIGTNNREVVMFDQLVHVNDCLKNSDNYDLYIYYNFMMWSLMRPQESIRLLWEDVNLQRDTISIHSDNSKKTARVIPILDDLKTILLDYSHKKLHPTKVLPFRNTDQVYRKMKRFLKNNDLEINITPKMFRRSMNSYFQEKGVPLTIAQQLLGHSNPLMTATAYTFYKPDTIKEAVEKVL